MFWCLKSGCPFECGTRRNPDCAYRILSRALSLFLVAVLVGSLWVGFKSLSGTDRSAPAVPIRSRIRT
jgi:hypothetical protein